MRLHRSQYGWIVKTKSVWSALSVIEHQEEFEQYGRIFHTNHIVKILTEAGADVRERVTNGTKDVGKTTIGKNQIENILNAEARKSDSVLIKENAGWYKLS